MIDFVFVFQANLQLGVTEKIRSELIGRAGQMVQVYNLVSWVSTEWSNNVSSTTLYVTRDLTKKQKQIVFGAIVSGRSISLLQRN